MLITVLVRLGTLCNVSGIAELKKMVELCNYQIIKVQLLIECDWCIRKELIDSKDGMMRRPCSCASLARIL